jgi:hypothetical protein
VRVEDVGGGSLGCGPDIGADPELTRSDAATLGQTVRPPAEAVCARASEAIQPVRGWCEVT